MHVISLVMTDDLSRMYPASHPVLVGRVPDFDPSNVLCSLISIGE